MNHLAFHHTKTGLILRVIKIELSHINCFQKHRIGPTLIVAARCVFMRAGAGGPPSQRSHGRSDEFYDSGGVIGSAVAAERFEASDGRRKIDTISVIADFFIKDN